MLPMLAILLIFSAPDQASALTINRIFLGGTPPGNSVGGGSLQTVFDAACMAWENAIHDNYTVTLSYGWSDLSSSAAHWLNSQGGTPSREISGTILFENNWNDPSVFRWFIDPTPTQNEEWASLTTYRQDLGGGSLISGRVLSGTSADIASSLDLYTIAIQMIGHALGLSTSNQAFTAEVADGSITVGDNLPYAGTVIPMQSNFYGYTGHPDIDYTAMWYVAVGERTLLSDVDILAVSAVSDFSNFTLPSAQVGQ